MTTKSFIDQLGNEISLTHPPDKIVSLVPSQTELLADLGLDQQIVGITKFCIHPKDWLQTKAIIGGTKEFHFEKIDALKPDLIIGNKEENYVDGIDRLRKKYPVWLSNVVTLEDAIAMILTLGSITNAELNAKSITTEIATRFQTIKKRSFQSVLYLIWRKPWMAAGSETFIHSMLTEMNLRNAMENHSRYPEVTSEQIAHLKPDLIFLSSEPYPFSLKHIDELRQITPASKILLVDGEMFSWYGSRLLKSAEYFNQLII